MNLQREDLKGKKVLVFGSGISGMGAAKLLQEVGAEILLYDGNEKLKEEDIRKKLPEGCSCQILLGELPDQVIETLDLAVMSPGVPQDIPQVERIKRKKVAVWGEVELAYQMGKGTVLAITGTNGKTTTTALLGEIMKAWKDSVFVVGNIGNAYTSAALSTRDDSYVVAEISSFQLETIADFAPKVSAILNITEDHLNRHHTMEEYIRVKERIAENQSKADFCILNYDDTRLREFAGSCPARVIWFSSQSIPEEGFFLDGDLICQTFGGKREELLNVRDMRLLGVHNYENVMAAMAIASSFGVPMEEIIPAVKAFRAVEHRIEFVAEKKGVVYYNDSKGTNPDAAIRGIRAMRWPTILIGGGYDKGNDYDEWIEAFDGKVKLLVLIGQTREKIAECARRHGMENVVLADSFEEAMEICTENAVSGDAVLLSPACASWGMFPNYEVRGQMFKDYVNRLEE